ncbi:MAG: hypothetical protein NW241_21885 [Bacteroidia bacterium]|nr:hypothetical protein [Bacteroidia bacterium]
MQSVVHKFLQKVLFVLLSAAVFLDAYAQPGSVDLAFNPSDAGRDQGFGFGGSLNDVQAIVIQPDGKVIAGGLFESYNGQLANRIIRLQADGLRDTTFDAGLGFEGFDPYFTRINAIALLPDGKILAGGDFLSFNQVAATRIVRLSPEGVLDTAFQPSGFGGMIMDILPLGDGKILIGGGLNLANSTDGLGLIRLLPNGSVDTTFQLQGLTDGSVRAVRLQPDGKILVAGDFSVFGGILRKKIARLHPDGTLDSSFNPANAGPDGQIHCMELMENGNIIVGGEFTVYGSFARKDIVMLNPNGSPLSVFASQGSDYTVFSIAIQPDGSILIGGSFSNFFNTPSSGIVRLLPGSYSIDPSFQVGNGFAGWAVHDIALQNNGRILVGGDFVVYQGMLRNGIVRLNPNASLDDFNKGTGFTGEAVHTLARLPDGRILAGGAFRGYNHRPGSGIARMMPDGRADSSFTMDPRVHWTDLNALIPAEDGKILGAGSLMELDGQYVNCMARFHADGTLDTAFSIGSGFDGAVNTLVRLPDGKILAGGDFSSYQGALLWGIVRLHPDGTRDQSFNIGTGLAYSVKCIAVQSDGYILAGGDFTQYNDVPAQYLSRLRPDGTLDTLFHPDSILAPISALRIQPDGKILAAYAILQNGFFRSRLVRLMPDGSWDSTFAATRALYADIDESSLAAIYSIEIVGDSTIVVGGNFTLFDSLPITNCVFLHSSGRIDTTYQTAFGVDRTVYTLLPDTDGSILVGGAFTIFNAIGRNKLVKLQGKPTASGNEAWQPLSLRCYPNPGESTLHLEIPRAHGGLFTVEILDMQGRKYLLPFTASTDGTRLTLLVEALPNGVYEVIYNDRMHGVYGHSRWIKRK